MTVRTQHPLFSLFLREWEQLRDTYRGERVVKDAGFKYLPPTSGMVHDGIESTSQPGFKAYASYRLRADYPEVFEDAVATALGVMHQKEATFELPKSMEPLLERATIQNETLQGLLRRINEEQLVMGRVGLMLEVPDPAADLPLVATYFAERIINWDEGVRDIDNVERLNLVVLNETEHERVWGLRWREVEKYRVLALRDPSDPTADVPDQFKQGIFRYTNADASQESTATGGTQVIAATPAAGRDQTGLAGINLVVPSIKGRELDFIPFVFCNTKDIVPTPDDGPLLGLSNLSLTMYRGNADYRQALFMQGQDTLVIIGTPLDGAEDQIRMGAGSSLTLAQGSDAKYIGVDSNGLPEMRAARENDYIRADAKARALLDVGGGEAESGEALKIRVAARTSSLQQIVQTGGFALEQLLRMCAKWIGEDPKEVNVKPNTDFVEDRMPGRETVDLMTGKTLGSPLSLMSVHENYQDRGLTKMTFEEEIEQMEREAEEGLPGAVSVGETEVLGDEGPEMMVDRKGNIIPMPVDDGMDDEEGKGGTDLVADDKEVRVDEEGGESGSASDGDEEEEEEDAEE